MKILKPILYCLLWAILAFAVMYFINNKKEKQEVIIDKDVPVVDLKVSPSDIYIWDTVTYTVKSRVESDNEAFENNRTFYYDFDGDWVWDLVTKKDYAGYIFEEAYEEWVIPKVAVEFRWKLWQAKWNTIYVKQKAKPILLYNSIWNTVVFRDLSMWKLIKREICFETDECEAWNSKFKKILIDPDLEEWTELLFSNNDSFLQKYDNYGKHNVLIYLKDRYWNEEYEKFVIETSNNISNWEIVPWINMITIPETVFTNWNPEIFLSKNMNNTLTMYINNESWETCYVDTDIAIDSDWDWKTDNDTDIMCNKLAKIKYEPDYESAWWRVYFMNNWKLTFKNFYVTFEWIILELDEEKREIYNDITTLYYWIEDISIENTNLKNLLDRLRKNLNNRLEVSSVVISIKDQINNWWIKMDLRQKESLDTILSRLENEDTIILIWRSEYDKNKQEILAMLPSSKWYTIKSTAEKMFEDFEENLYSYTVNEKEKELEKIWNTIIKDWKKNRWMYNENDFTPYFCNIYDYYNIVDANKCSQWNIF